MHFIQRTSIIVSQPPLHLPTATLACAQQTQFACWPEHSQLYRLPPATAVGAVAHAPELSRRVYGFYLVNLILECGIDVATVSHRAEWRCGNAVELQWENKYQFRTAAGAVPRP
jgi:hypothetical protein